MNEKLVKEMEINAARCRLNVLRMLRAGGHGHVGGAFSAIDIITALYFYKMRTDPENPKWEERDRFLLSAGHKCLAQYAVLAEKGFFPKDVLDTYGSLGSHIPGHPDMYKLPGVEGNTGALGHGLAISCGMAMAFKQDGKQSKVFTVLGDGELAEGSNWEAAAAAAHYGLDNLMAFVDFNGFQISGRVEKVMNFTPIKERFEVFGWAVGEIDGNDMRQILEVLDDMPFVPGKPCMIVAHTVKAKGLPCGENDPAYHFWNVDEALLREAEEAQLGRIAALQRELEVCR